MPSPACAPLNCGAQSSDGEQGQQGTGSRVDNRTDQFWPWMDVQFRQHPPADECAGNSYDEVPENSESYPFHKMAYQPSRDATDYDYGNQVFAYRLQHYVLLILTIPYRIRRVPR